MRKVNELVKRVRMARVHSIVISHLKKKMPFFGQQAKQKQLLDNLAEEFFEVMKKTRLPQGDFPNLQRFKDVASTYDFAKFPNITDKMLEVADASLSQGIPDLLRQLADEQDAKAATDKTLRDSLMEVQSAESGSAAGGGGPSAGNPFGGVGVGGRDLYAIWSAQVGKTDSDSVFKMLPGGQDGLVSGAGARDVLLESGLEPTVLRHLWDLSDVDKDGFLSAEEFALCWYLVQQAKAGKQLPERLPPHLVPPAR